jgi:hypothetical protein
VLVANLLLARGKLDEAQTAFDALLSVEPSNLHALMGKVCTRPTTVESSADEIFRLER